MPVIGTGKGLVIVSPGVDGTPYLDERTRLEYVSPAGRITEFTDWDAGRYLTPGATGLDAPPFTLLSSTSPARDGSQLIGVHVEERPVFLPIAFVADNRAKLLTMKRDLIGDLDPRNGQGELRLYEPSDGSAFRIPAMYVAGMEGDEGESTSGLRWLTTGIKLVAHDPAWLRVDPFGREWVITPPVPFGPILPTHLSSASVIGVGQQIDNPGTDPAFPVWTVNGPFTVIGLTKASTGEHITITYTGSSGDVVTIDTRPGFNTITLQDGTNLWDVTADDAELFWFDPGTNIIDIAITGAGTGTSVAVRADARYLTA